MPASFFPVYLATRLIGVPPPVHPTNSVQPLRWRDVPTSPWDIAGPLFGLHHAKVRRGSGAKALGAFAMFGNPFQWVHWVRQWDSGFGPKPISNTSITWCKKWPFWSASLGSVQAGGSMPAMWVEVWPHGCCIRNKVQQEPFRSALPWELHFDLVWAEFSPSRNSWKSGGIYQAMPAWESRSHGEPFQGTRWPCTCECVGDRWWKWWMQSTPQVEAHAEPYSWWHCSCG